MFKNGLLILNFLVYMIMNDMILMTVVWLLSSVTVYMFTGIKEFICNITLLSLFTYSLVSIAI